MCSRVRLFRITAFAASSALVVFSNISLATSKASKSLSTSSSKGSVSSSQNYSNLAEWESLVQTQIRSGGDLKKLLSVKEISKNLSGSSATSIHISTLKKARDLFAASRFKEAIAEYNKIPRDDEFWLEALEEKGWAHFRLGEFNESLAQIKTLHAPQLVQVSDPETFYLSLLTRLRTCDYLGMIETINLLKNSQRERYEKIEKLSNKESIEELTQLIQAEHSFPLRKSKLGRVILGLPRLFHRDRQIQEALLELHLARKTTSPSWIQMAQSSRDFNRWSQGLLKRQKQVETGIQRRIHVLSKESHQAHLRLLQKVQIFEVELLQRLYADREADTRQYQQNGSIQVGRNQISFPLEERPWMDELGQVQTELRTCAQQRRRL